MTPKNIKSWGARRDYSFANLSSEYDGDYIAEETIQEMLNIMSFESIQNFNNVLGGFNEGRIPQLIQNKINILISVLRCPR